MLFERRLHRHESGNLARAGLVSTILLVLATGCQRSGAPPEPAEPLEPLKTPAAPSRHEPLKMPAAPSQPEPLKTPAAPPRHEEDTDTDALGRAASNADARVPTPVGEAYHQKLPQDADFVAARLPEWRPERYDAWRQQKRLWVGKGYLHYADFLPGEKTVVVYSQDDYRVRTFDRRSGALDANLDVGLSGQDKAAIVVWYSKAARPTGQPSAQTAPRLVTASNDGLWLHDTTTGRRVRQLAPDGAEALRWSADGHILGTLQREPGRFDVPSVLRFYQRHDNEELELLHAMRLPFRVDSWDLSRDNRLLALNTYARGLIVVDLHEGKELLSLPAPSYSNSVAFSPDGRSVAIGGQGLLLVDLLNPQRRAFYSYFYNNIDTVTFSPSGDAIATCSYDGHVRLFSYDLKSPSLSLLRSLRHEGRANVSSLAFSSDGNSLLSSSGDRTARIFGAPRAATPAGPARQRFHNLAEWARLDPKTASTRLSPPSDSTLGGHYLPARLKEAPKPSSVRPGRYKCKITDIYKLRDCTVEKNEQGHTLLSFADGNLLTPQGVLYDDGSVVRYEAWLTQEDSVASCEGCEKQPLHGFFRKTGSQFRGLLTFRPYHDPYRLPEPPAANTRIEEASDRFPMTLQYVGPLPERKPQPKPAPERPLAPKGPRLQ